ncbi:MULTISPECIES: enoyl-CoA hydratase/isomerase family protein [unclassified Corynebacterium]|uniref:enoyl-CoA hydratase/isomerase family protein n=1 Tax=unclassified Corynebacterium TaxID=2624378 RepID=UPI0029CA3DD7|nr:MULTISPECIES: enoyl-CoA hydratase/isomerase family protein [unclassified Corynebacterium]WPF66427.1 enoyl-CoA hydratase/isomerase family protein [Corynebacterium sp. 22KM0430]WPF68917.1 enoyl-CoA hydratase/isomerase family protein [Corynebacterium sp. 21KM1197]
MARKATGKITVEERGPVLLAHMDGGELQEFGPILAQELEKVVDRADADPNIHAVVFTGTHPDRFMGHAEVRWLQEGGATVPSVGVKGASALSSVARGVNNLGGMESVVGKTPLWPAIELERTHETFLKMNRSGVIFIAALNGSALGLGAEFAWANDVRIFADGDHMLGQPEVLFGIMPGGGGTQRLTRLIGTHRSLMAVLEGKPFSPAEALEIGAVDAVVLPEELIDTAIAYGERLGSRAKTSLAAIKRSIYFGGSDDLESGLHVERAEFLATALSKEGQAGMLDYMAATDRAGELPLYQPGGYEAALREGTVRAATRGSGEE